MRERVRGETGEAASECVCIMWLGVVLLCVCVLSAYSMEMKTSIKACSSQYGTETEHLGEWLLLF